MPRPHLWQCPDCHRTFANRNQTHTCTPADDVERHFAGRDPSTRTLFNAFAGIVRDNGPVTILGEKTRIAFHVRMSFAQVSPRNGYLLGHFVFARRVEHPRFRRIETISRRNHVHHFRIDNLGDLDDEFRAWVAEAYAVGEQKHLQRASTRRKR
ncbi:MAG: DUF5655 domain-containing protein [Thermoanaerobaculia bacterium]